MKQSQQTTLRAAVTLVGTGVHSGDEVKMILHPAEANHGIAFLRTGLPGGLDRLIDARHLAVTATELCTVIGDRDTGAVATIERLRRDYRSIVDFLIAKAGVDSHTLSALRESLLTSVKP